MSLKLRASSVQGSGVKAPRALRAARGMSSASEERRESVLSYRPTAAEAMPLRGMTLIESLVGTALMLVVFLGIFAIYQVALDLVFSTKAATGGTALVNEQMEYIRGLSYDAVGTVNGIPSGAIFQTEERILNGIPYTLTTLIQYVDDPADGLDALDENGITADYKLVRVGTDWIIRDKPRSTFAVTRISPPGIESLGSGGTLRVNVFDVLAAPVSGASVHIVNETLDPAVDVTVTTGATGSIAFPGAPPGSGYEVTVTKPGYSSAETYDVTVENPNPNPGHVSVVHQTTSTVSLEINVLGTLLVSTFSPQGPDTFDDEFESQALLSATTSVTVAGGSLVLEGESGSYASSGSAHSLSITPQYLVSWTSLAWTPVTPADTSTLVYIYYWDGTAFSLVPDTDLPGNSAGFSSGFADLSTLPAVSYGTLQIRTELASSDPVSTPEISAWSLGYTAGPTPLPNVSFDIHGARTTGISAGGTPIYKYDDSHTTTQFGEWSIDPIEADAYTIELPAGSPYTIAELCPSAVSVGPGNSGESVLILEDTSAHSLRVVVSGAGAPLSGALVALEGAGADEEQTASACGQVFFGDLPPDSYTISVSAAGYQSVVDSVNVSGDTVTLVPLIQ